MCVRPGRGDRVVLAGSWAGLWCGLGAVVSCQPVNLVGATRDFQKT
jgi:hypothetical protein